jgi:hypothetical protein
VPHSEAKTEEMGSREWLGQASRVRVSTVAMVGVAAGTSAEDDSGNERWRNRAQTRRKALAELGA